MKLPSVLGTWPIFDKGEEDEDNEEDNKAGCCSSALFKARIWPAWLAILCFSSNDLLGISPFSSQHYFLPLFDCLFDFLKRTVPTPQWHKFIFAQIWVEITWWQYMINMKILSDKRKWWQTTNGADPFFCLSACLWVSPDCTSDQVKAVPILDEQQHHISHSVIFPLVKTKTKILVQQYFLQPG